MTSSIFTLEVEEQKKREISKLILILKELSTNITFMETLKQMSSNAKFIKDLVINKQMERFEPIDNMHHYIVITSQSLVEKNQDLEAFTILPTTGSINFA